MPKEYWDTTQGEVPICYIDVNKACYKIAENGEEFLCKVGHWKECLIPCAEIEFWSQCTRYRKSTSFLTAEGRARIVRGKRRVAKMWCVKRQSCI